MKRKFLTKHMLLALGIFTGFITLGVLVKLMNPESSADSFFIEGIILSSLPFWLTPDDKINCKSIRTK